MNKKQYVIAYSFRQFKEYCTSLKRQDKYGVLHSDIVYLAHPEHLRGLNADIYLLKNWSRGREIMFPGSEYVFKERLDKLCLEHGRKIISLNEDFSIHHTNQYSAVDFNWS